MPSFLGDIMRRRAFLSRLSRLALGAFGLGLLGGCGKKDARTETASRSGLPTITVGVDNYPPFNYTGTDGRPTGIDVELAKEAFHRMGYEPEFLTINWERKKTLLENGGIDCIWSSFSMDGREDEYQWAGPYMRSSQVVAVNVNSDIYTLADLEGKTLVVQSTTKPEQLFEEGTDPRLPRLRALISLQDRDLIYTTLIKGYADALAAHETAIRQFMKDYGVEYRILEEPLQVVGLGVAFAREDRRGLEEKLNAVFEEMRVDGTTREIVGRYLDDPGHYLDGLEVSE